MPAKKTIIYPGFELKASELSAYILSRSIKLFIISLKNGDVIHFQPDDVAAFEEWLRYHKIRDVQKRQGHY